jgi:phenylpropionate dioxygenase-like ring-hydroxylating dioxygenase large terminal subunit
MHTTTVHGDGPFTLTPAACEALGEDPVPVDSCTSQGYFEKERDLVFRKSWLCMGREDQIPKAGDYVVKELELFNTSLLIARGRDGVVRGFHNVCSHRCNKLVWDGCGTARSFVCRFHGWTYQTDGPLRFVPEEETFPPIDYDQAGLAPVATDVWRGFIFVKMDNSSGVGLQEFMAPFTESLAQYPFEEYTHCYSYRTIVNANWKLVLDAFLESFHVRFLHKKTVAEIFRHSKDDVSSDAFGFEVFSRHGRFSVPGIPASRSHPVEDLVINTSLSFYENKEGADSAPPGLNPARGETWAFDGIYVFPNTIWLLNGGASYAALDVLPLGPDRTIWEARTYSPPARDGLERFAHEYHQVLARDTMREDASTLERTQAVLSSGAKPEMILGDQEIMLRHLHHIVDQVVNGAEASIA